MGGNKMRLIFIFFIYILIHANSALAGMACGEVKSLGSASPEWKTVTIYYTTQPSLTTSCKVSPQDNKYCCDPEDIKGAPWAIGKNITATIMDFQNGYAASSVQLKATGEGYDVFPPLILKKVITVTGPSSKVILASTPLIYNISILEPLNKIKFYLNSSDLLQSEILCENCTSASLYLSNLSQDSYTLTITAENSQFAFNVSQRFTLIDNISLKRTFSCKGCLNDFIPSNSQNVSVTLILNTSLPIEGTLFEQIPLSFKLSSGQETEPLSDTHQQIKFYVNASTTNITYAFVPPPTFLTKKFTFQAIFEDIPLQAQEIYLSHWFRWRWFSFEQAFHKKKLSVLSQQEFYSLDSSRPVIISANNSIIQSLALFPSREIPLLFTELVQQESARNKKGTFTFALLTNMPKQAFTSMQFSYRMQKSCNIPSKNTTFFTNMLTKKTYELPPISQDADFYYYTLTTNATTMFTISCNKLDFSIFHHFVYIALPNLLWQSRLYSSNSRGVASLK